MRTGGLTRLILLNNYVSTEQYIFDEDAADYFYQFIETFHERFVGDLVMTGAGKSGLHIEKVPMSRMGNDEKFCAHLLGGMLNEKPTIHIRYADKIMCNMYVLDNGEDVCGSYMYQCVYEYPEPGYNFYTFWECGDYSDSDVYIFDK